MAQLNLLMSAGPGEVERFRRAVAGRLGLMFEDARLAFLGDVLRRRMEARAQDAETYLARLEGSSSDDENGPLAQELTVPETYFFRNLDQFKALSSVVLPERVRANESRRSLRILSAGCASGDEAYSIAITAREVVPDPSWELSVRGVDVNPVALERAARGRFTTWSLRETPAAQTRWFRQDGRELVLDEAVCRAVRLDRRNLAKDDAELWPPEAYDVVFCRNVIMYFTPESAQALVARIARSMVAGGYLFLGHAETLRGISQAFHLKHTHGTFYYQRKDAPERSVPAAETSFVPRPYAPLISEVLEGNTSWVDAIQRASDRIRALALGPVESSASLTPRAKPELHVALDLLRAERFSEALDVVRALPAESAFDPDALLLEAVLLTHGGQLKGARAACERLLAVDELSAGAHYVLALCCESAGDRSGAGEHDQVAIYLDPTFAMPRLHLGLLARRAGELDAAKRELQHALLLLQREEGSRVLLFGGGFGREALGALCAAELSVCEGRG